MTSEDIVLREHRRQAVLSRTGEMYFRVADAREVLTTCEARGFAVVGAEGYTLADGVVHSPTDLIRDFSRLGGDTWTSFREAANAACSDFFDTIRERRDLVLWLTIVSEDEWNASRSEE
jgi:hypothetical protein